MTRRERKLSFDKLFSLIGNLSYDVFGHM